MRRWRMACVYVVRLICSLVFSPVLSKQRFALTDQCEFGAARGGDIDG